MTRPSVDIVVPFVGSGDERRAMVERLDTIELSDGDTVTLVDNGVTAAAPLASIGRTRVIADSAEPSSYYARNRGAEGGSGEWILFLDDDVEPSPDVVERYFDPPPDERTGVIAGGVRDAPLGPDPTLTQRFAAKTRLMAQDNTVRGEWAYAQTANALVRRAAFEQIGGFTEGIRSGGDADLCFRLRAAGWELEARPDAFVWHQNRARLRSLLRQRARHGAGMAWLAQRHPGSMAAPRQPAEIVKGVAHAALHSLGPLVRRDRDRLAETWVAPLAFWATEVGRRRSNDVQRRG